jgi:HAD superfamily hydrolase (TIGR01549 family)
LKVTAVVFDLDGTIASFNIDYMAVRSEVRSFLIGQDLPASVMAADESIFDMLKKAETYLNNNGKPEKVLREIRDKALAIAEKYELEAARSTSLLPGVVAALKKMKKMGLKIGLCTVNSDRAASYILKRFKIAEYFDVVVPRNGLRYVKPNSEHLEVTLKALGVGPENAVLVGDGTRDMQCAKELKVIAVGLPTGASSIDELIAHGADYIVTSVADVPRLVGDIDRSAEKLNS